MKTLLRFRPLASAALLLALALPVASAADAPAPAPAPAKRPTLSIDFPGGSITKFVAALPKTDAASVSIVGEATEMATELPAFSLRNVDPQAVAQSLRSILFARDIELTVTGASSDSITATVTRRLPAAKRIISSSSFESFQLTPFLGTQSVDDIVGAIRLAWELDPTHEKEALRIKFHPPTSILLVSGPGSAIDTAKNVLSSLRKSADALTYEESKLQAEVSAEVEKRKRLRDAAQSRTASPEVSPTPPAKK